MRIITVHAERGLPGGLPQTYRFGGRVVRGAPGEPLRIAQPGRICGLAIAHDSEVRAVMVRLRGSWVPLVEGQPLAFPDDLTAGLDGSQLEIDALETHPHDGMLRLQIAEAAYEVPFLSRHVSPVTRLSLRRLGRHVFDEVHRDVYIAPPIAPTGVRQYLAISPAGSYDAIKDIGFGVWGGVRGPDGEWRWRLLGTFFATELTETKMFASAADDARHVPWEAWKIQNASWEPEDPEDIGFSALVACGWDTGDFERPWT